MKRVAIIGAGLAGTACAYVLHGYGMEPVLYEEGPEIAPGASGNALGLYNPRLAVERTPESDFYAAAFALALRAFSDICHSERSEESPGQKTRSSADAQDDIEWQPCGSLHLMTDEKREKRFRQCTASWRWPEDEMQILSAQEASAIAGVPLNYDALYLPRAGYISPRALCERYAEGAETHLNAGIGDLSGIKADAVILACGMGASKFENLPLKAVRGQVTDIEATAVSKKLRANLCYGGYVTPALKGKHMVGSTFQRWLDHSEIIEKDDADNVAKLVAAVPALEGQYKVSGHRAAVRTTTADHFPIVGQLNAQESVYVSTAHGSHGILSTLMAAHLLADMITGGALCLPQAVVDKLSPVRYGL